MPFLKTRNLFISHAWTYGDAYDRLVELLNEEPLFSYRNYSVPKDDPVHNARSDAALRAALKRQMSPCHVVLVMAGVYSTYSKWIKAEIDIAKIDFQKPVLGIKPRAQTNVSSVVCDAADELVSWNTKSIVGAIRRLSP